MSPKLITTIIAIIIGILATLAGIRYGGEAFNSGRSKAEALTVLNAAEQVKGAADLHYNLEGSYASSTDTAGTYTTDYEVLLDADDADGNQGVYLTEDVRLPTGASIDITEDDVTITGVNDAACEVLIEDEYDCAVDSATANNATLNF
jgi:Tfp pilus assembly protein PilE